MFYQYIWVIFGLALVAQGKEAKNQRKENDVLVWPEQYHLKAIRSSLTSGIIEDYEIWRLPNESRIDYNKGLVKSTVRITKSRLHGIKYEVHPEATRDGNVKMVCNVAEGNVTFPMEPETILPPASDFTAIDKVEMIADKNCTIFQSHMYFTDDTKSMETVWALRKGSFWIPVRYEYIVVNSMGSKSAHHIWDFFDFEKKLFGTDKNMSYRRLFSVRSDDCKDNKPLTDMYSEEITKHLKFVDTENEKHIDLVFDAFTKNYNKTYSDARKLTQRKRIFRHNMRLIKDINRRSHSHKLSINQFADKLPHEIAKHTNLLKSKRRVDSIPFPYTDENLKIASSVLPKQYDARMFGLVSSVKEQDTCSSSWVFAATAAVEGALARTKEGPVMALSTQALIDCAWPFGGNGCTGGSSAAAYEWMMEFGLPTEAEYGPYINKDGACRIKEMKTKYPIRGFTVVTPTVEAVKVALVNYGPLSVSVSLGEELQHYSSGILYDKTCSQNETNYEMTLVGYGECHSEPFWILKNSWGPNWGLGGYVYIYARDNNCLVTSKATYVVF